MKKIFLFICLSIFLVGCSKNNNFQYDVKEVKNDFITFKFIKEISGDLVVEYTNKLSEDVNTSEDNNFKIYKKNSSGEFEELKNTLGYKDISLIIKPNDKLQQSLRLSKLSPTLDKGEYELRKEFKTEKDLYEVSLRLTIK